MSKKSNPADQRDIFGIPSIPVVFLAPVTPFNPGEIAEYSLKKANKLIKAGLARRAKPEDFEDARPDLTEDAKVAAEQAAKAAEEGHPVSSEEFNHAVDMAEEKVGPELVDAVLGFYDIDKDGRRRSEEKSKGGMNVLGSIVEVGGVPDTLPGLAPWQDDSLIEDLAKDWENRILEALEAKAARENGADKDGE